MDLFYNRLECACSAKGMTVAKVCTGVGLHRSAYLYWKHGKTPNRSNLRRIATYLGVTPEYLESGKSEDSSVEVSVSAA